MLLLPVQAIHPSGVLQQQKLHRCSSTSALCIVQSLSWAVTSHGWGNALPLFQVNLHPAVMHMLEACREDAKCCHAPGYIPTEWHSLDLSETYKVCHPYNTAQRQEKTSCCFSSKLPNYLLVWCLNRIINFTFFSHLASFLPTWRNRNSKRTSGPTPLTELFSGHTSFSSE